MDRIDQWEWDMKMICDKTPYAAVQYIRKNIGYEEYLKKNMRLQTTSFRGSQGGFRGNSQSGKGLSDSPEWFAHIEEYRETLRRLADEGESKKTGRCGNDDDARRQRAGI